MFKMYYKNCLKSSMLKGLEKRVKSKIKPKNTYSRKHQKISRFNAFKYFRFYLFKAKQWGVSLSPPRYSPPIVLRNGNIVLIVYVLFAHNTTKRKRVLGVQEMSLKYRRNSILTPRVLLIAKDSHFPPYNSSKLCSTIAVRLMGWIQSGSSPRLPSEPSLPHL